MPISGLKSDLVSIHPYIFQEHNRRGQRLAAHGEPDDIVARWQQGAAATTAAAAAAGHKGHAAATATAAATTTAAAPRGGCSSLTAGGTKLQAAELSNYAAGVVVAKMGAVAVSVDELKQAIKAG